MLSRFSTRQRAAETHWLQGVQFITVKFALVKLLCCDYINKILRDERGVPYSLEMRLATLCTRLDLEFDLTRSWARELTESMVGMHMRIAFNIPEHNDYINSGTPSEPLLAEAAAMFMNVYHHVD